MPETPACFTLDHSLWCESMRHDIDRHVRLVRDAEPPSDPRIAAIFADAVEALQFLESRLAWLRYVAESDSTKFDSGDAGALARAEARPLAPQG